jgi:hypothetical protein
MNYICFERYNTDNKEKSYVLCKSKEAITEIQRNRYLSDLNAKKDVFHKVLFIVDDNSMNDLINSNTVIDFDMEMITGNLLKNSDLLPLRQDLKEGDAF